MNNQIRVELIEFQSILVADVVTYIQTDFKQDP